MPQNPSPNPLPSFQHYTHLVVYLGNDINLRTFSCILESSDWCLDGEFYNAGTLRRVSSCKIQDGIPSYQFIGTNWKL